jgi:hypothetical protein
MPQSVNVSQFAFAVEDFLGPFAGCGEGFGEGAEEFDDLGNVVVVFAVFGSALGVEEVVAGYELKGLVSQRISNVFYLESKKRKWEDGYSYHCGHTPNVSASTPLAA